MDQPDMVEGLIGGVISNAAYDLIKVAASRLLDSRLGKDIDQAARDQAIEAYQDAMEEWLIELIETFDYLGFEEEEIRHFFAPYQEALPRFLADEEVADELLRPFTDDVEQPRLDHAKLIERWQANGFPDLPAEFPAGAACTRYLKRLNQKRIVTPELRDLLRAQMERTRTDMIRDLRGHWPDFDLDQYCKRVRTRYRVLDLSALTPPERDNPDVREIRLRDVFVPQDVREYVPVRELPKEYWHELTGAVGEGVRDGKTILPEGMQREHIERLRQEWVNKPRQPVLEALGAPDLRQAIILGDPGSGKSALAHYLLLNLVDAERRTGDPDTAWLEPFSGHLPLLAELSDYAFQCKEAHCRSFLGYWHHLGLASGFGLNEVALGELLEIRPSLVIFDGLDEILEGRHREDIVQQIIGFAHDHPAARIIVTSRITGYQRHAFDTAGFKTFTLQDFSEPQIETFAHGWFDIVYHGQPDEAAHRRERIAEALEHSPSIRQLAGNPLLLTMIAIIARHQELPRDRAKLYEHAVKVLCHHWDLTGHKIPQAASGTGSLREDDKLELLRRIAWRIQQEPKALAGNYILEDDLYAEIEAYFRDRWQLQPVERASIAHAMVEQLRARNFILCLYGSRIYGFVHRTFLEFFCAQELAVIRFQRQQSLSNNKLRDDYFAARRDDEVWHEILRLVCGMVDARFAGQFIDAIVPPRQEAGRQTDALILAINCLSEVADLHRIEPTCDAVLAGICGWFEADEPWDRRDAGAETRFLTKAVPSIESIGPRWPGGEAWVSWLSTPKAQSVTSDGIAAFGRIVRVLWSRYPQAKRNLEALLRSGAVVEGYLAADALARCFPKDPETLPLLRRAAEHDQDTWVRSAAVEALAWHFAQDLETLPLLRRAAEHDQDTWVRSAAVWAMAGYFIQNPETLPLVRRAAEDDQSANVRSAAVEALARHFAQDPETLPLLRRAAEHDQDGNVRGTAVRAAARHFAQDPKILPMLRNWAETSKHDDVRRTALLALGKVSSVEHGAVLLSCDLDGMLPGLDPREPIDDDRVARAAKKLGKPADEIRRAYERLAKEVPIRLAWQDARTAAAS